MAASRIEAPGTGTTRREPTLFCRSRTRSGRLRDHTAATASRASTSFFAHLRPRAIRIGDGLAVVILQRASSEHTARVGLFASLGGHGDALSITLNAAPGDRASLRARHMHATVLTAEGGLLNLWSHRLQPFYVRLPRRIGAFCRKCRQIRCRNSRCRDSRLSNRRGRGGFRL